MLITAEAGAPMFLELKSHLYTEVLIHQLTDVVDREHRVSGDAGRSFPLGGIVIAFVS